MAYQNHFEDQLKEWVKSYQPDASQEANLKHDLNYINELSEIQEDILAQVIQ